jgi:hypothetical protein
MLPNFLIVGAQKAGTTSLWHYLRSHEDVFLPDNKEPGFFAEEFSWSKGIGWYESLFCGAEQRRAVGEASTYYTMYPYFKGVPKRIASLLPDVRIIYIMRDPIERMRSCYIQLLTDGQERRPMKEALFLDAGYVYLTRYAMQIRQYFDYFPENQILLMTAEDLRYRRTESLRKVFSFLGVREDASVDMFSEENQSSGKRAPRAQVAGARPHDPPDSRPRDNIGRPSAQAVGRARASRRRRAPSLDGPFVHGLGTTYTGASSLNRQLARAGT